MEQAAFGGQVTGSIPMDVGDQAEAGLMATGRNTEKGPDEELSGSLGTLRLEKKRLSGAQRKQLRKQRQAGVSADSGALSSRGAALASKKNQVGAAANSGAFGSGGVAQTQRVAKRGPGSTPGSKADSKRKRMRGNDDRPAPYSSIAKRALQIVVALDKDPLKELSKQQCDHIRQGILDLARATGFKSGEVPLRFEQSGITQGNYKVSCADEGTLNWLFQAVPQIPALEGENFVALKGDLPLTRVHVWIPGATPTTSEGILAALAQQNPELQTSRWRIFDSSQKDKGHFLILGLDADSVRALEALDMRPYHELGRVVFHLTGKARDGDQR
ncbi:MAG: DUF4780 domain-containing protein [Gammaproteobacteria bacterium]|nr:DUF4780 domain-containing protein [Gammaproteobacteria bacterium]